jgi:hypothetical protein
MAITFINRGHFFVPHVKPVLIDCNFIVDSANGNGLGIRSLKGQGVANVFMHTSATPGKGSNGQLNPNPAAGYILVQLTDNFQRYFGGFAGWEGPVTSPTQTSTTAGNPYVITSLGTASAAQWLAAGVPPGVTPGVGVSFIALQSAAIGGSATVGSPSPAGIDHIEGVGDPNQSLGPIPVGGSPNVGGWLLFQADLNTTPTAPSDNSVISMSFYLSQSSVQVAGE